MLHFKASKLASLALTGLITAYTLFSAAPGPAIAADVPRLAASDLFVDLDKYVGQSVVLESVHVYGADNEGALAESEGVTFFLSSRGMDRETIRLFLRQCHDDDSELDGCELTLRVTPTREKMAVGPVLKNVFIEP